MTKKAANRLVIFVTLLVSLVIGFIGSGLAVVYYALPTSESIPDTYITHQISTAEKLDVSTIKDQDLSIHFLELGNRYTGDCTLIKVGETEVLIDAGSKASSVPVIQSYLNQFVTDGKLEYVIATHAHEDHIAGFGTAKNVDSLLDLYEIGTIIQFVKTESKAKVYQNYCREVEEAKSRGTKVFNALECYTNAGDGAQRIYPLSDKINLEILDQQYYHDGYKAKNENDNSVCCQIVQNSNKYYLFTGDLGANGEASLVERNTLHPVELYKAGHHGSKTSSTATLLSVIKPKRICVCCCAGSSQYTGTIENQFPTQTFIDNVAQYTDTQEIYVTTLCTNYQAGEFTSMNGNIVFYSKNEDDKVRVACSHNETILKDTDWFKANRKLPAKWAA